MATLTLQHHLTMLNTVLLLPLFLLHTHTLTLTTSAAAFTFGTGEALGISVGGGGGGGGVWVGVGINNPSPPNEPSSTSKLAQAYFALQTWKSAITDDPVGVLRTWVGQNVCSYKGVFCSEDQDFMGNPVEQIVAGREMQRPQPECSEAPGGGLSCLRIPSPKPIVCGVLLQDQMTTSHHIP